MGLGVTLFILFILIPLALIHAVVQHIGEILLALGIIIAIIIFVVFLVFRT